MSLAWNHLNLPKTFTFAGNKVIAIVYDASGRKLRKTVTDNGTQQYLQDYAAGIEYRTTPTKALTLESIYHSEGRVYNTNLNAAATTEVLRYEYVIKDHLGNARLTFTDKNANGQIDMTNVGTVNEVIQESHYYPFGLDMPGVWINDSGAQDNQYKYNGKELNGDFGLGWYNYGKRWYDPATGRFPSVDPIISDFPYVTPYNYAENEPVASIDLHGLQRWRTSDGNTAFGPYKDAVTATGNTMKGVHASNQQQYTLYKMNGKTTGGDTKLGIQDNTLGRVKNGKPVGAPVVRFDAADKVTTTPHINGPKGTNFHMPIPGGEKTLNALEGSGKVLDALGKVAKPVAIATDVARLTDAYNSDGGQIGPNTQKTTGSIAGGWTGAYTFGIIGTESGAALGALGGPAAPITVPIGAFLGGITFAILGSFGGSYLGEKVVEKSIENQENKK